MQKKITIPYNLTLRDYQIPIWKALDNGVKRIIQVWHRRAGKDVNDWNLMIKKAFEEVGTYYYFLPTYAQGKKVIWDGITLDAKNNIQFRMLDYIPKELRYSEPNSTEMKIVLKDLFNKDPKTGKHLPGSIIQIIGTDKFDSIMGTNPRGVVFSEYSLQDPQVWSYIRPILLANGGWAIFNFTPRGENHAYQLLRYAETDPNWFVSILTVDDTGFISKADLAREKIESIAATGDDAVFYQEYYCSFQAAIQGAYYYNWIKELREKGRINPDVKFDPKLPVWTAWDIGVDDHTCIWFGQTIRNEIRLIDYYENRGKGLDHYAAVLDLKTTELGYKYGTHIAPHDMDVREFVGDGKTRAEIAEEKFGIKFEILTMSKIMDGIEAVRANLPKCYFNSETCARGIECLVNYHTAWDDKRKTFRDRPEHDWSSHGADAFRYFILGLQQYFPIVKKTDEQILQETYENQEKNRIKAIYDTHRADYTNQEQDEIVWQ